MDGGITLLIPISFFLLVFGLAYLFISTRNKERLALIEKGVDASVFTKSKRNRATITRIVFLNLALLLMGIGTGIFIATLIDSYTRISRPALYPATTFITAGLGLLIGFFLTKKMDKKES